MLPQGQKVAYGTFVNKKMTYDCLKGILFAGGGWGCYLRQAIVEQDMAFETCTSFGMNCFMSKSALSY